MKRILSLILVLAMALTFVACGGSKEPAKTDADKVDETIKPGEASTDPEVEKELFSEERTVRLATSSDIVSLDPVQTVDAWSAMFFVNIYETLLQIGEDGEPVVHLAESYEKVDELTYDFKLPQGVKFHNGEELKASDVAFTFKRAMESPTLDFLTADIESCEATDEYTVRFKLKAVSASFLSFLTHSALGIVSQKAVEEFGDDFYKNPVGTGPYKLDEWNMGVDVQVSYFEDYHGEEPDFTKVIVRPIPEGTNRTIELEAGSVDVITHVPATDYNRVEEAENLELVSTPGGGIRLMGINTSQPPLDNVKVRQAIAYAIDAESINHVINMGFGTVSTAPISPAILYHNDVGANIYDPGKAKELLAEAGYPDGLELTISTDTRKEYNDIATIIQQQLAEVGIKITLDTSEWAVFLEDAYAGKTQMYVLGWTCSTPDPDTVYYSVFHSDNKGPGGGMSYLEDEEIDHLITEARTTMEPDARKDLYEQINQRLAELRPWVYLYDILNIYAINSNKIGSIILDANDLQRFYKIYANK